MANETVSFGTDPGGVQFYSGGIGCFFRIPAAPAARTALMEVSGGAGYIRVSLGTDMTVLFEPAFGWNVPNLTSGVLNTGVWYWISVGCAADGNQTMWSEMFVWANGATFSHPTGNNGAQHAGRVDVTGIFAIGVGISSAYAAWPNNAAGGWLWSKPRVMTTNTSSPGGFKGGAFAQPTSDWTLGGVGSNGGAWNCREAVGSPGPLADISGNAISLLASAQGLTVAQAGPYP